MRRVCNLCGQSIQDKGLSAHLKKLHGVAFQAYVSSNLNLFPDYHKCLSQDCNNILSPRKKTCSKVCDSLVRSTWIGSLSHRMGVRLTATTKTKIRQKLADRRASGNDPRLGKEHTKETRHKISSTRLERGHGVGEKNGMYGKTHTPEAIKKIFEHKTMNKFEKAACDLLDQHSIAYKFQFFLNHNGTCKSYDIQIKDTKILVELDGDYWHGNPSTKYHHTGTESTKANDKLKDVMAEEAGFRLIRVWESEFKSNPNILIDRLSTTLNEQATRSQQVVGISQRGYPSSSLLDEQPDATTRLKRSQHSMGKVES